MAPKEVMKIVELTCQRRQLYYRTATGIELEHLDRLQLGTKKWEFNENWTSGQIDRRIRKQVSFTDN